jgi:hypothetical protein
VSSDVPVTDIRNAHRNLYRLVTALGVGFIALGLNFLILNPTFQIYDQPNWLWGAAFLALGAAKLVFLNTCHLKLLRAAMSAAVGYNLILAIGTSQPAVEGTGSLQLPIFYALVVAIQVPMLLEPFSNPVATAARKLNGA